MEDKAANWDLLEEGMSMRKQIKKERKRLRRALRDAAMYDEKELAESISAYWESLPEDYRSSVASASMVANLMVTKDGGTGRAVDFKFRTTMFMAVARSLRGDKCEHAILGKDQLYVFLAPRIVSCQACLPGFMPAMLKHDARQSAEDDDWCDLCLEEAGETRTFYQTTAHFGPCVVKGDLCKSCVESAPVASEMN